ncbi:uncharacterized protein BJ212DRAFT_391130 [Suillus subaureus]|uniref:RRM domain-containing protein n=1 Tax=Suillus subaureus TaxID=48587 RepID=A0A9P7DKQ8_9AGAM|nr:uncharacterized protein BJ212DRAFT_391130 [Suillus subaureus]KAG1797230.1 hypothetical protein BJ212DRAFT_391130 [Suillus subaureus]
MHTMHQHALLLHQKPETGIPPHHAVVLVREVLKPTVSLNVVLKSSVWGAFRLSIRTQGQDLDEEFSCFGRVEKVTIVYDQRSDRSCGFGFIGMSSTEEATRYIQELNGILYPPSILPSFRSR